MEDVDFAELHEKEVKLTYIQQEINWKKGGTTRESRKPEFVSISGCKIVSISRSIECKIREESFAV
jgi:hypothetical protein